MISQMQKKMIKQPLGLIDPDNLKPDEFFLFSIDYEMFPGEVKRIYAKAKYLVIQTIFWNKLDGCFETEQCEFPLDALPWIVDRFENGFFKSEQDGGVSNFERSLRSVFNDELIGINAMAHCCAENMPGFNIWNSNRASYVIEIPPQQWDIPSYMLLDEGLLAKLKDLANKYQAGQL